MFIRSDKIKRIDILNALIAARDAGADINIDWHGIREFKPRNYEFGYQFCCVSNFGKRSRGFGKDGRAASWTDYGLVMAYLYKIDPQARIGNYTDATNFIKLTTEDANRRNEPAPWLNDRDLMIYA